MGGDWSWPDNVGCVPREQVEEYGIANLIKKQEVPFESIPHRGLVEKPSFEEAPSNLAVLGRYILPSAVLDLLEHTEVGVGGEIQLTDALDELIRMNGLNGLETDASIHDCGKKWFFECKFGVGYA